MRRKGGLIRDIKAKDERRKLRKEMGEDRKKGLPWIPIGQAHTQVAREPASKHTTQT